MFSFRLSLALVALTCGGWLFDQAAGQVGLFTIRYSALFGTDQSGATVKDCPDGCAGGRDGSLCVSYSLMDFYIESLCYPDLEGDPGVQSSFMPVYDPASNKACFVQYTDTACTNLRYPDEGICAFGGGLEVGVCDQFQSLTEYYPGHCVESSEPTGDYTVPMTSFNTYDTMDECTADPDQVKGTMTTVMDDRDFCLTEGIESKVNDIFRFQGGIRSYCDDQSNLIFDMYSDWNCSAQDADRQLLLQTTQTSTCQQSPAGLGIDTGVTRTSCNVKYHCKDLSGTPSGLRIPFPTTTGLVGAPGSTATTGPTPTTGPTSSAGYKSLSSKGIACWSSTVIAFMIVYLL